MSSVTNIGDVVAYDRIRINGNMPAITANTPIGSAYKVILNTPPIANNTPKTTKIFITPK